MNVRAALNTLTLSSYSLPIVILYVTEGCNLRCITCSYRSPLPNELSLSEIRDLAEDLRKAGLRHIAYSGGEPLMRRDFPEICKTFATDSVKQTLLTNGLLLEKRYDDVYHYLAEIIVSLDGADALTHNKIRGLESFDQILKGIRLATSMKEGPQVSIRTVLQKENFHQVVEIVHLAKLLGVNRISFLTADVLSEGFGRDTRGSVAPNEGIVLSEQETVRFRELVETAITEFRAEFQSRFISQSPAKMLHLVEYYEALIGRRPFPRNICNAPMVSAVITATGDLQPCFFLPTYGNVRRTPIRELIDSSALRAVRRNVTAYSLERCHKCVCTLYVRPTDALFDRF